MLCCIKLLSGVHCAVYSSAVTTFTESVYTVYACQPKHKKILTRKLDFMSIFIASILNMK